MMIFRRICLVGLLFLPMSCADFTPPPATQLTALPEIRARFDSFPPRLAPAVEAACNRPEQRVIYPTPELIECRTLMPPDPTGSLIMAYDGTLTDLPETVIRFHSTSDADGLILAVSFFIDVPQASGGHLFVALRSPALTRRFTAILRELGGTPI
ncbi:hypothetical protein [Thalassovita taeanensis]|uniref:Uncharacterized protein n=1 Tax=Thalassovita taeanensis TaxID=657014 RepID=A0A1H8YWB1_9RHOB|nr:hypothetical protein [Thalassovita taeanensis]SEP56515.1 hypothetical protein SAMN04488092_101172 [Thalassovita taeanensis]